MAFETQTLCTIASCITGLLGVFLLLIWVQERGVRALAWWGAAYLIGGSAVALWTVPDAGELFHPEMPSILLFVACGMLWSGARLFHGRPVKPGALFAGATVWMIATICGVMVSDEARVLLCSVVIATYAFLTARELHRERRRKFANVWLTVAVPLLHGLVFLSPVPLIFITARGNANAWLALFALETLLYVVGTAFIVIVMAKERALLAHKTAALTDMLTGLPNRRAVQQAFDRLSARQGRKKAPVSALLFDLDRFKSINDRFGHAVGDEILKVFACTLPENLRTEDVYGRLGGEEFVVLLDGPVDGAVRVAERLRRAFQAAGVQVAGHRLDATVSIGVASGIAPMAMDDLFAAADAALYRAKGNGRNRVEIAPEPVPTLQPATAPLPVPAAAAA